MHYGSHFAGQKWNRVIDFYGDVPTLILTYSSYNYDSERLEKPHMSALEWIVKNDDLDMFNCSYWKKTKSTKLTEKALRLRSCSRRQRRLCLCASDH